MPRTNITDYYGLVRPAQLAKAPPRKTYVFRLKAGMEKGPRSSIVTNDSVLWSCIKGEFHALGGVNQHRKDNPQRQEGYKWNSISWGLLLTRRQRMSTRFSEVG